MISNFIDGRNWAAMNRPKTIICDIDGVIFKHHGDINHQHLTRPQLLPNALKNFQRWDREGCHIILVSGRRESTRTWTEKQLSEAGIFYDKLILGVGGGTRILINDMKPNSKEETAIAYNLIRNEGMSDDNY